MKKGIKALSVALLLMFFACISFLTKPKAKADPISVLEIGSVSDWNNFVNRIKNNQFNSNYSGAQLTADLDFGNTLIKTVGTVTKYFTSTFDGAGHTITGKLDLYTSDQEHSALFNVADNAVIKNLNLNLSFVYDYDFAGDPSDSYARVITEERTTVSALVGEAVNSTIENCHLNASIIKSYRYPDAGSKVLENIGGLVGVASNTLFKDCSVNNTGFDIEYAKSDDFDLNIGGLVGVSNGNIIENCTVKASSDFVQVNVFNSKKFNINIGGLIGKATGENEIYHSDILYGDYEPVVSLLNTQAANSTSNYNIGGFIGKAEYTDTELFKGNLVTSSIVSEFVLDYDDVDGGDGIHYKNGANINFAGVIGNNPANDQNNPLITVINSAINVGMFPVDNENRGILAGIDEGNGIYYDVFCSSGFLPLDNFGSGSARTLREIDLYNGEYVLYSDVVANGSATYEDILNYNALQSYGPAGSSYINDPTKVKADFDAGGSVVVRRNTPLTAAELVRTVEYYYSSTEHPTITWIKGSNAYVDYDRTITYDHYDFVAQKEKDDENHTLYDEWYSDTTYATVVDLENIEASEYTLTVYPKLQAKVDTVTLNQNGKTSRVACSSELTIAYEAESFNETLVIPVATGYTFEGYWVYDGGVYTVCIFNENGVLDKTNATYFTDNKWTYGNNLELRAKWSAKVFTINYDTDGGDGTGPTAQTIPYSDNIETTVKTYNGTKTGYSRNGWKYTIGFQTYTILENNSVKTILDRLDIAGEGTTITLVANWVQVRLITVNNGNAYASTLTDAPTITQEETGTTVYVKGNAESCKAVTGWTTVPADINVTQVEGKQGYWQLQMPEVDVTLTPVYGPAHNLTKTNAVDPNCTNAGSLAYWTCNDCHKAFSNADGAEENEIADLTAWLAENGDGYVAPLGHNFEFKEIEWNENTAKAIYDCSRCDATEEHACTITHEVKTPATCTSVGTTTYTATYESHTSVKNEDDIPMAEHQYEWVIDQEATYDQAGIEHKECSVCHDIQEENTPIERLTCAHEHCTIHDGISATCEDPGYKGYEECNDCHKLIYREGNIIIFINDLDAWQAEGGDGYIAPLGHHWGTPTYEWSADTCTALMVCTRDESHTNYEVTRGDYVKDADATCTENEKGHFVAEFTIPEFETQTSPQCYIANTALGHTNHVEYVWSSDNLKVSAYNVCSVCNNRELIEEVDAVYVKVTEATCTANEVGKRTATFTTQGLENQETERFEVENTKGHVYGNPVYIWSNGVCTATRTCERDQTHQEVENATGIYQVVSAATCTANETGKYTATFTNPAFEAQESPVYEKTNSALGHEYVFTRIEWTSFTAQAVYTCSNDNSHVVKYDCVITSEVTKSPTCVKKGVKTYTATYETHTDTKTEELNLASHSTNHVDAAQATHDAAGHIEYYECSVCHKLFSDAEGSHEISQSSTVVPKLVRITVYGASISNASGNAKDIKVGDKVTIEANAPEEGKEFKGWALSEGGPIVSTNSSIEITVGSDIQYYAVYGDVEKAGLPLGALIGIIAGSVALIAGVVVVLIVLKKKKKPQE